MAQLRQGFAQVIDRVVRHGHRAVAALVTDLHAKVQHVLLGNLNVVRNFLPVDHLAPAAFVQAVLGIDPVAVILQQPVHAVVRSATLFVRRQSDNQITVGLEPLALVANQVGDPDGGLRLVVRRAASVKKAALFAEHEWIEAPVFALGLDHVDVCQ